MLSINTNSYKGRRSYELIMLPHFQDEELNEGRGYNSGIEREDPKERCLKAASRNMPRKLMN